MICRAHYRLSFRCKIFVTTPLPYITAAGVSLKIAKGRGTEKGRRVISFGEQNGGILALQNIMWLGLRNGIIMRNTVYE